jgi:hypothetical protein
MNDDRYRIFRELTENATAEEQAVILELLKENSADFHARASTVVLMRFLLANFLALSIFFVEMLYIVIGPRTSPATQPRLLFGSSSERNTSNIHLLQLVKSTDREFDVLIFESPIRRFKKEIGDSPKIRKHWCRTFETDIAAIVRFVGASRNLSSAAVRLSRHRDVKIKTITMSLVRLLRGISISNYLENRPIRRLVFTLSGNACTSTIELRLKGVAQTIHWLHGVGLGFNFDSFSDQTLVNNEYDYHFYRDGLCGKSVFYPDNSLTFLIPKHVIDIDCVIVYSNLIHPNNQNFERAGIDIERELLEIVSSRFRGKTLLIKPHPASLRLLGRRLDDYLQFLEDHNFRLVEDSTELVGENTLYISTVSTSFIDLMAEGKCVFMYEKFASHHSGFQNQVSPKLKFQDSNSFNKALSLLDDSDSLVAALESFAVQSQEATFRYLLEYA